MWWRTLSDESAATFWRLVSGETSTHKFDTSYKFVPLRSSSGKPKILMQIPEDGREVKHDSNKCICDLRISMQTFPDFIFTCVPEVPGASRRFCKSEWSMHVVSVGIYTVESSLKPKLQHAGNWSATAWPPHHLFYRPAIFFRHLRLIGHSLPQKQIRRAYQKMFLLLFPFFLFFPLFFNFFLLWNWAT
jgi:hypothetical protein